jgi:hypothetical protein
LSVGLRALFHTVGVESSTFGRKDPWRLSPKNLPIEGDDDASLTGRVNEFSSKIKLRGRSDWFTGRQRLEGPLLVGGRVSSESQYRADRKN